MPAITFYVHNVAELKAKLLHWSQRFSHVCVLDSQNFSPVEHAWSEGSYDLLAGIGCIHELIINGNNLNALKNFYDEFCHGRKEWLFGYLSYDLKNEIEKLSSRNHDRVQFPEINFFVPEFVFELSGRSLSIRVCENSIKQPEEIFNEIQNIELPAAQLQFQPVMLSQRISKKEYIEIFESILKHIQQGDVYELNFCQEFYSEGAAINPLQVFHALCEISPAPFSCYYKLFDNYLICSSPERFLRKKAARVFSQPMKGTIQRGKNQTEDLYLKLKLQNDEKERSENVMIVDLVRNDLSRIAQRGTVKVDELCGIYSFSRVHQMISTVSCEAKKEVHPVEIIKACFPMGSMTGAPKIRARYKQR